MCVCVLARLCVRHMKCVAWRAVIHPSITFHSHPPPSSLSLSSSLPFPLLWAISSSPLQRRELLRGVAAASLLPFLPPLPLSFLSIPRSVYKSIQQQQDPKNLRENTHSLSLSLSCLVSSSLFPFFPFLQSFHYWVLFTFFFSPLTLLMPHI